jgi:hypothetical protein
MAAVTKYVVEVSKQIKPLLCSNGGSIIMVQVENEYGSYSDAAGGLSHVTSFHSSKEFVGLDFAPVFYYILIHSFVRRNHLLF